MIADGSGKFRFPTVYVQLQIGLTDQTDGVTTKPNIGGLRYPGFAQQLIIKGDLGADDLEPGQVAHGVIFVRFSQQLIQEPKREILRLRFSLHETDANVTAQIPANPQPRTE